MTDRSTAEIERWERILSAPNGRQRLQSRLQSIALGRECHETLEDCLERRGLTAFWAWAVARNNELVCCDCGHTVQSNRVLSTRQGTSCPRCYHRLSEGA